MRRRFAFLAATLAVALAGPAQAPAASPFDIGIVDPLAFAEQDPDGAYDAVRSAGMRFVRLPVAWGSVAPTAPAVATNPDDPAYGWADVDKRVASITSRGLQPLVSVYSPPAWARARRVADRRTATAADFAAFMTAAARRYQGRVTHWQLWNEPNLRIYFEDTAQHYRALVNAAYDAIHGVSDNNVVVAGGLGPFRGNPMNDSPLAFMRRFFCLSKGARPRPTCRTRASLDAWSHHPYTSGGPNHSAQKADDVSLGQLPQVRQLLRAAVRAGHIRSRGPLRFWATEFSWETNPPDPGGISPRLQARWTAEGLYRMWQSGVSLVVWLKLRDGDSEGGNWANTFQGGLYFKTARLYAAERPKPVAQVLAFPFVALPEDGRVKLWGRTPDSRLHVVTIERRRGRAWSRVVRIRSNRHGIFTSQLRLRGRRGQRLRARVGAARSVPFHVKVTRDVPLKLFGG